MKNNLKIQVFGSGCPSCKKLFELVKEVVVEMNFGSEVEYVTDVQKIIKMGFMTSPVLVVGGKPIFAGSVPHREKLKELLENSFETIS